jgi:hypothetical protein
MFLLLAYAALACAAQSSSGSNQQSQSPPPASPAPAPSDKAADGKGQTPVKDPSKEKKKPKKVWTEDDMSSVRGSISVVGDSNSSNSANSSSATSQSNASSADGSAQSKEIEAYRDRLRQLQAQLDATDKKIADLRNFKADNSSASGGINPNHGYSMTPIPDQIKQLEEKKKQIQDKIDTVTDEARKKGIDPGQLR